MKSQIALKSLERLIELADNYLSVPHKTEPAFADGELAEALKVLHEGLPTFSQLLVLLEALFARQFGNGELDVLRGMVIRAGKEQRRQAVLLHPDPARHWLGFGYRRYAFETSYYPFRSERVCPTEQELSLYFTDCLYHLGPLRDEPKNLYSSDVPTSIADVGRRGERAIACLLAFGSDKVLCPGLSGSENWGLTEKTLIEAVTMWGKFLGIYDDIEINAETKYGTVCKVATSLEGIEVRADLTNVGVGVSQLLPVVVLCLAVPVGSTLLIEQPELHLHPSVQLRLAEFLAACALTGRQVVVETHSEHLVNGIRLLASRGWVQPERDVALSFIEKDEYGTRVTEIPITQDGTITRWPRHFFDEAEQTLSSILRSKVNKR
jgi:hypothetical protein